MTKEEKDILKENEKINKRKYRQSEEYKLREGSRLKLKRLKMTSEEKDILKENNRIATRKYRESEENRLKEKSRLQLKQ